MYINTDMYIHVYAPMYAYTYVCMDVCRRACWALWFVCHPKLWVPSHILSHIATLF